MFLDGPRRRPLNESEARHFIDWANWFRSNVTPTATNMPYMVSESPAFFLVFKKVTRLGC